MDADKKKPLVIDIRLKNAAALFASLDPSPLVERDLDDAVEEFIVDWAMDAPERGPVRLVLHLAEPGPGPDPETLGESIRNFFAFMAAREERRIQRLWREGRQDALVGILFLIACMAAGQAATRLVEPPVGSFLSEGLLIIGWVANWRPVQIFLYDWRPIARRRRIYSRLADLELEVKVAQRLRSAGGEG
ncbi:MAG TPA: hypothetical protein VNH64_05045 [Parvularculaceae bacterium]|nr:hypothetical protein [Parvularculaceae bacterium]